MNRSVTKRAGITIKIAIFFYIALICVVSSESLAAAMQERIGLVQMKTRVEKGNEFNGFRYQSTSRTDQAVSVLVDYSQMIVSEQTQVYRQSGLKTDFDQLPIPCSARIRYQQLPDGNMEILELHIVEVSVGADKKWGEEAPH